MAKARAFKKHGAMGMELPECPICLEVMTAPIFNCQSGHSLCSGCTANLRPKICPMCRKPMTDMRNRTLEDMVAQAVVPCPNKADGCVFTFMGKDMNKHLKECIFREKACPLEGVSGSCVWKGKTNDLYKHFKDCHPKNCDISTDSDVALENISVTDNKCHVFLVMYGKLLFLLTVKFAPAYNAAYFVVQHIGSKKIAQQHVYEIHIVSQAESRRKAMFLEYCYNDDMPIDEIFREGKCGILSLSSLNHFIKGQKLVFKLSIERSPVYPNPKFEKTEDNRDSSTGPGDTGPRQPRPRGPGPRGRGARRAASRGPHASGPRCSTPLGPRP